MKHLNSSRDLRGRAHCLPCCDGTSLICIGTGAISRVVVGSRRTGLRLSLEGCHLICLPHPDKCIFVIRYFYSNAFSVWGLTQWKWRSVFIKEILSLNKKGYIQIYSFQIYPFRQRNSSSQIQFLCKCNLPNFLPLLFWVLVKGLFPSLLNHVLCFGILRHFFF